ncbi:MAG TPA: ComF family protein [bacterium]|nr:ComF family protein [bacterium]
MPAFGSLLNVFFPPRCAVCRDFLAADTGLCPPCEGRWPSLSAPFCATCAMPFVSGPSHRCGDCFAEPPAFEKIYAAGLYEDFLLDLVVRLKYRGEERLARLLGDRMATALKDAPSFDVILPVPLHAARLRERGFNQAVLLARRIGKKRGTEVDPFLLKKVRETPAQATLARDERKKNVKGAFLVADAARIAGKRVLLVDDVATTGATLNEAAKILITSGAAGVEAAVAARAA